MAQSFARRIEQSYTTQPRKYDIFVTLETLFLFITGPSIVERLQHINFEVDNVTVKIRPKSKN
jgi:hypothetical protein